MLVSPASTNIPDYRTRLILASPQTRLDVPGLTRHAHAHGPWCAHPHQRGACWLSVRGMPLGTNNHSSGSAPPNRSAQQIQPNQPNPPASAWRLTPSLPNHHTTHPRYRAPAGPASSRLPRNAEGNRLTTLSLELVCSTRPGKLPDPARNPVGTWKEGVVDGLATYPRTHNPAPVSSIYPSLGMIY